MGTVDYTFPQGADEPHRRHHTVEAPEPQPFLKSLQYSVKETLFPDDPFRQFKNQNASRKVVLGLQYFFPICEWAPRYNLKLFKSDLIAGITIASLAIPQGISYAKLANLPPILGLFSTMKTAKGKDKAKTTKEALKPVDDRRVGKRKAPAEKGETRKEKKAKKDPNKPKRAPSAFFVFLEDFRTTFKKDNPNVKAVSAEKAPYEEKAAKRKAEYEKLMDAYNKNLEEGSDESEKSRSEVNDEDEASEEVSEEYISLNVSLQEAQLEKGKAGDEKEDDDDEEED
ncbi:hypothetical protein F2Q69_00056644 [Brassica cretica]|uniref:HMG box domain-containing protein n=1 Tax=Brassica cretica TaxID=69181 RepID=A0A8S9N771_BRACR|nr:hypothetical protein F2Q69_00056644 [Brassica cretica]